MYEELNTPLPDDGKCLQRIGFSAAIDLGDPKCLDSLIYAWQLHVPFEDIDTHLFHLTPSLAITDLYDKIVVRKRGGYCFEMNALFTQLLLDLGFHASSIFCRIVRGKPIMSTGVMPPCTHRAVLVRIGETDYFCDVGFGGPMPPFAVPVTEFASASQHGETFHIRRFEDRWWILSRDLSDGGREDVLHFNTTPQEMSEFIPANFYCANNPSSIFVTKLLLNRRTADGNVGLTDESLTVKTANGITKKTIRKKDDFSSALRQYFGINL